MFIFINICYLVIWELIFLGHKYLLFGHNCLMNRTHIFLLDQERQVKITKMLWVPQNEKVWKPLGWEIILIPL